MTSMTWTRRQAGPGWWRGMIVIASAALMMSTGGARAQGLSSGYDHEGLAKQMLEQHIRPGYAAFATKSAALATILEAACKSKDAKGLAGVRAAFKDTLLAWAHVEHLRLGPAVEDNRVERIMFWPDRQQIGERQVRKILSASDATALAPASLYKKSVAVQGYTALEVLLYGKPADRLLTDTPAGKFACAYATAISANVAGIAKAIVAAWAPGGGFVDIWLKPGEANPLYKSASGPTFEALKAYRFGINNPREIKMLPALGLKRNGSNGPYLPKAKPPFELSGLSLATIIANTEGVLDLYDKGGFAERLAVNEPETSKLIKSELENVLRIMKAVEPSGSSAFEEPVSKKLALAREPFVSALIAGGEALATDSGMVLGFTDDDGD